MLQKFPPAAAKAKSRAFSRTAERWAHGLQQAEAWLRRSGRRRGIDPFEYLRDALTRLPRMTMAQVADLLPAAWAAARPAAA